jgi:hypothetical protein
MTLGNWALADLCPDLSLESGMLSFDCPICKGDASHLVGASFPARRNPDLRPKAVWEHRGGLTVHDLTLFPSIRVLDGCGFHCYVTNGRVIQV